MIGSQQGLRTSKPISWERPGASRGNTKAEPRSAIRGFLPREGVNDFEARMVSREVQKLVQPLEGLVGLRNIFVDRAALLMEITSWEAVQGVQPLCEDIVALSPKWALIRTGVRTERWSEVLSNIMRTNPYECILRIQWRQSYHGGRPWAMPAATSQQIQAVRVQAKAVLSNQGGRAQQMRESTLVVEGNLGPHPSSLVRHMMTNIQSRVGTLLREVSTDQDLLAGDWTMCLEPATQEPTGRVRIKLPNTLAAKELENAAHNQVVTVGGEALAVKVNNFHITDLPRCQGNATGAPGALVGPPPGL